ncbi:MAG: hypothetical protein LBR23_04775, partial [Spirochaetaceae bacterium]|nr:hypothetical protein [Spirochaetaceae bacterium]
GAKFKSSGIYLHYASGSPAIWTVNTTDDGADSSAVTVSTDGLAATFTVSNQTTAATDKVEVDASALATNANNAGAVASGVGSAGGAGA